jgi:hypothetical protein
MKIAIIPLMMAGLLTGCHCTKDTAGTEATPSVAVTGPQAIVYKVRKDLMDKVPVILSADGSTIVSYPHPSDLKGPNGLAVPTVLHKGYLLDNRGINKHVAFLNMTYEAYAALPEAPTEEALMTMLKEKKPLLELCDCGSRGRFTDVVKELDQLIDDRQLRKTCKVIK